MRAPVTMKIKFKSATLDQFIERYSVDVSRGGIFIRTKDPLAVGTPLRFEFQLQDAQPLISGEGTVVWIREPDPTRTGVAPGMGVRFDKLAPQSQQVLDKILAEKLRMEGGAGSSEYGGATRVASLDASALAAIPRENTGPGIPGMLPEREESGKTGFETNESTRVMAADQAEALAQKIRDIPVPGVAPPRPIPIPRPVAPPTRRNTPEGLLVPTPVPSTAAHQNGKGAHVEEPAAFDPFDEPRVAAPTPIREGIGTKPPALEPPPGAPPSEGMALDTVPLEQTLQGIAAVQPTPPAEGEGEPPTLERMPAVQPSQVATMAFEPTQLAAGASLREQEGPVPELERHWDENPEEKRSTEDQTVQLAAFSASAPTAAGSDLDEEPAPPKAGWFSQEGGGTADEPEPVVRMNGTTREEEATRLRPIVRPASGLGTPGSRTKIVGRAIGVLLVVAVILIWWGSRSKPPVETPPPEAELPAPSEPQVAQPTPQPPSPPPQAAPSPPAPSAVGPQPEPQKVVEPTVEPKPLGVSVAVKSKPDGAKVTLDGVQQGGLTPTQLEGLEPKKSYQVKMELKGYKPHQARLVAKAGATLTAVLQPIPHWLDVQSTPHGARVLIDGKQACITPCMARYANPSLTHKVELKKSGFEDVVKQITPADPWEEREKEGRNVMAISFNLLPSSPSAAPTPSPAPAPSAVPSKAQQRPVVRRPAPVRTKPTPTEPPAARLPDADTGTTAEKPAESPTMDRPAEKAVEPAAPAGAPAAPTPSSAPAPSPDKGTTEKKDEAIKVPDWMQK